MSDTIQITIRSFENYKGRSDVKLNSWFRLSNRFLEDSDFFDFTLEEKLCWIYILSLSSQKNSATVSLNFKHAEKVCGIKKTILDSAIKKLNNINALSVDVTSTLRPRYVHVTSTCATGQTEQDRQNITGQDRTDISTEPQNAVTVVADEKKIEIDLTFKKVHINKSLVRSWSDTYPKDYLEMELKKARSWLLANQAKAPKKDFGKFLNSWFDRGWERYRKTMTSNQPKASVDELMDFMGWQND